MFSTRWWFWTYRANCECSCTVVPSTDTKLTWSQGLGISQGSHKNGQWNTAKEMLFKCIVRCLCLQAILRSCPLFQPSGQAAPCALQSVPYWEFLCRILAVTQNGCYRANTQSHVNNAPRLCEKGPGLSRRAQDWNLLEKRSWAGPSSAALSAAKSPPLMNFSLLIYPVLGTDCHQHQTSEWLPHQMLSRHNSI